MSKKDEYNWRRNRFIISLLFIGIGLYSAFRPSVALKILDCYASAVEAEAIKRASERLVR